MCESSESSEVPVTPRAADLTSERGGGGGGGGIGREREREREICYILASWIKINTYTLQVEHAIRR